MSHLLPSTANGIRSANDVRPMTTPSPTTMLRSTLATLASVHAGQGPQEGRGCLNSSIVHKRMHSVSDRRLNWACDKVLVTTVSCSGGSARALRHWHRRQPAAINDNTPTSGHDLAPPIRPTNQRPQQSTNLLQVHLDAHIATTGAVQLSKHRADTASRDQEPGSGRDAGSVDVTSR